MKDLFIFNFNHILCLGVYINDYACTVHSLAECSAFVQQSCPVLNAKLLFVLLLRIIYIELQVIHEYGLFNGTT